MTRLKQIWKNKNITLQSKTRLMRSLIMSIFLYACETLTLTAELQRRVKTMEMRCYQKILCISYKDNVTNKEVHNRIQQAIGPYEDLLTTVKRQKLKWYGHVSRTSGLTKTTLQGTVRGARRQARQRKRWEDNIKEWTGLDFSETQRAADEEVETAGCKVIGGAPTTLRVTGLMMIGKNVWRTTRQLVWCSSAVVRMADRQSREQLDNSCGAVVQWLEWRTVNRENNETTRVVQ